MDSFSCLSLITPRETRDLPTSIPTYFNAYLAAVLFFVIEAIAIVTKHLKYDNTINLLSLFFFSFFRYSRYSKRQVNWDAYVLVNYIDVVYSGGNVYNK